MSKLTFLQLAHKVLNECKTAMSVDEIWSFAVDKDYISQLSSTGKTPSATLGAQLYLSVKQGEDSQFATLGSRPKRFYLKSQQSAIDVINAEPIKKIKAPQTEFGFTEKQLHPFVAYYANLYLHAYCKTINHSKSDKNKFGEWLHPDIVACYFPMEDWEQGTVELSAALGVPNVRLYSFELKRALTFSNLRESFFQAVSNSSWAHEGYLCAAQISAEDEFQAELKRLSGSFGIGVISIDLTDPDSTTIIYPAKSKENLDWEGINKLCVNSDFREFISRVRIDLTSKEVRKEKYDQIIGPEKLKESVGPAAFIDKLGIGL